MDCICENLPPSSILDLKDRQGTSSVLQEDVYTHWPKPFFNARPLTHTHSAYRLAYFFPLSDAFFAASFFAPLLLMKEAIAGTSACLCLPSLPLLLQFTKSDGA